MEIVLVDRSVKARKQSEVRAMIANTAQKKSRPHSLDSSNAMSAKYQSLTLKKGGEGWNSSKKMD